MHRIASSWKPGENGGIKLVGAERAAEPIWGATSLQFHLLNPVCTRTDLFVSPPVDQKTAALRARVERMLRKEYQKDDLLMLLLTLREMPNVSPVLRDLGDFLAHEGQREKGIACTAVAETCAIVRYFLAHLNSPPNSQRLPNVLPAVMANVLRRLDDKDIRRRTGLTRKEATRVLRRIQLNLHENPDGTLAVKSLDRDEYHVFKATTTVMPIKVAYSASTLFRDFQNALERNALLLRTERKKLAWTADVLALLAVATMHGATVLIPGGSKAVLMADAFAGYLQVKCTFDGPESLLPLQMSTHVFDSERTAAEHCTPELLSLVDCDWEFPIELNADRKLAILGAAPM